MTLRGKDYCNCAHARMYHRALQEALHQLLEGRVDYAEDEIVKALNEAHRARVEYEIDCEETS